ncbi:helicase HerA domain-containing protein [Persephonella sp.]
MEILPKEEILPRLKKLFSSAKKSIKISSPWIKAQPFSELIGGKKVKIEVVIRNSQIQDFLITDRDVFRILEELDATIYLNPDIHSKFVIVDDRIAVIGSANLTSSGLYIDGNIETAVVIDSPEEVKKLIDQFEKIKSSSINLNLPVAGIILNAESAISAEVLLFESVPEQTYVKIPDGEGFILGRVAVVKEINDSLFSTIFTTVSRSIFSEPQKLEMAITDRDPFFRKALLFAYLNEKNAGIRVARLEILARFKDSVENTGESILKTPMEPPGVGSPVFRFEGEDDIQDILKINHAGYPMGMPVRFGNLYNTRLNAYIDMEKIYTMHMAVLGTTGSGKTTFVRRILENLDYDDITVYVFDLYGEYGGGLKNAARLEFPDLLFPVHFDNIKDLFREYGVIFQDKSSEEKRVSAYLRKNLKPDLQITGLREKSLYEILLGAVELTDLRGPLRQELDSFIQMMEMDYTKRALSVHPEIVEEIFNFLGKENVPVVFNFSSIEDPVTRVNLAGLIMKEIFKKAKKDRKKRVIVLEEAQNFAPEKGFGDVQSGSSNPAFIIAKKIATEGRKLNLGLIAITQRPANISKYILSQLNTQAVFKLINRNDLEAVSVFFEYSKEDIFEILPFLKPGTGFVTGLAVPFGILTGIRLG